eukprot:gene10319-13873_t
MSSTTTTKKEIIDFLWEWADSNGDWAKLLVSKIVTKESHLDDTERTEVFDYFLKSIGLKIGLKDLTVAKPIYTPVGKKIRIVSLSEVKGVNRLAENQTINFSENLTVIYGENGTGKTGYGRILKSLGFSYDTGNIIYPDIYKSVSAQSAVIKYSSDGNEQDFAWAGSNTNNELSSISVFNNNCVRISLAADRRLIVSPIGFHLFNIITNELNNLSTSLDRELQKYPKTIAWAS